MKTLAFALLIPIAICTACSKKEESAMTTPAPVAMTDTAPATAPAPMPAPVAANAGAPAGPTPLPPPPTISLTSAPGRTVNGILTITGEGGAVSIRGDITGLTPGKEHGFHLHEVGDCSLPDFASAGAHYNPTKDPHGGPNSKARHMGDLANVKADADGRATVDVMIKGVTLMDTDGAPSEIMGKSLVVHAMPDDYKTQPSGNSGDRIACGVIR